MKKGEYKITSLKEIERFAEDFVQDVFITQKNPKSATFIFLHGNLGAGKTTFTQACARAFGITETITSPTFVIQKRYEIQGDGQFKNFIHIDAYRLESGKELETIGWQDILKDPSNIIFLEWPEKVSESLPKDGDIHRLFFEFIDEKTRKIRFK